MSPLAATTRAGGRVVVVVEGASVVVVVGASVVVGIETGDKDAADRAPSDAVVVDAVPVVSSAVAETAPRTSQK
jgi:hypothetical protein